MQPQCRIDHSAEGAIPEGMCRACHPLPPSPERDPDWKGRDRSRPELEEGGDIWLGYLNRYALTEADRKAIEEIKAGDKRPLKKRESIATMKAKAEDKANADAGGRWDSRLNRWVTDAEELERAKRRIRQNAAARRKLKHNRRVVNVARKPRSKRKVGTIATK